MNSTGGSMLLTYLNYFSMIVGYITILFILLFILLFIGLILKERYRDWKWKKGYNERQKQQEQQEKQKESTSQGANIEVSAKQ